MVEGYLKELENCNLCEWRCGVNRLEDEVGVCMLERPQVASTSLHPAPPESYTVFMAGCNFRCLNCQNWRIAHFPEQETPVRGELKPKKLAKEAVSKVRSKRGKMMGADRIFFSGGSPTPSLPYIEKIVEGAKKLDQDIKINYDTNGFMTPRSLERVIDLADSITFDIKAFDDEVHKGLTGAPLEPVLRNAEKLAEEAEEKLWEFRYLLVPGINEGDVEELAKFLCDLDEDLPLNFLAFRPNFVMEDYRGARSEEMEKAVEKAKKVGLCNVSWSGKTGLAGKKDLLKTDRSGAEMAEDIAEKNGCITRSRKCSSCARVHSCEVKNYQAERRC
ncbi:MAG: radical SAM protein [Candidatus Thermoplasmatota archaeon]|nr:radical SAM protein [Candidatus Thermoplasmatota archaeon]